MRFATSILAGVALALCACGKESSFDDRYSKSENEIQERARALDESLNGTNTDTLRNEGEEYPKD